VPKFRHFGKKCNTPKHVLDAKWQITYVSAMPNVDLIPTVEAAEMLNKDVSTVLRLAKSGKLPYAVKIPGKTGAYLFSRKAIEKLVKAA
jgi:excisionase family DNA binding protein